MPVENRFQERHYGHEVELEEGDFVLTDSVMPSRTAFREPNTSLGLMLPYETLLRYLPNPEAVFGRRVGAATASASPGTMLRAIWT
jgi:hypothetical protein